MVLTDDGDLTRRRVLIAALNTLNGVALTGIPAALAACARTAPAPTTTAYSSVEDAARLGFSASGVSALENLFSGMVAQGLHPAAQLAVFRDGRLAIELAAGDAAPVGSVTSDTLFQIRSTTKALVVMLMMQALEAGYYELDDPVAMHWPEFSRNGKSSITVAQVLSHQAGIPDGPMIGVRDLGDRAAIAAAVENMRPIWKPGTANGYHPSSVGWISDELLHRWTGKAAHELLAENIAGPVGADDFLLGLPPSEYPRMAHMTVSKRVRRAQKSRARFSDFLNTPQGISLPLSWVSGVSNARSLGMIASILAHEGTLGGRTYYSKETQKRFSVPTNRLGRIDRRLSTPIHWGLGFFLGSTPNLFFSDSRAQVIGHAGGGATIAWADPANRLAVAFLSNHMLRGGESFDRTRRIGDAIYAALA